MTSGAEGRASVLASATPIAAASVEPATTRASWWRVVLLFAVSLAACVVAYLAVTVPGAWFPGSAPRAWAADSLTLTRGEGARAGDELVVTAPDATGLTLVSVVAKFRSSDYPAVTWAAIGIPDTAIVRLLWYSDYTPQIVNSAPVAVEAGRPLPVLLARRSRMGRQHQRPCTRHSGAADRSRCASAVSSPSRWARSTSSATASREWLAFEGWTGTSINTIVGGADIQGLSLPALLAGAVALAVAHRLSAPAIRYPQCCRCRSPTMLGHVVRRRVASCSTPAGPGISRASCRRPSRSSRARTRPRQVSCRRRRTALRDSSKRRATCCRRRRRACSSSPTPSYFRDRAAYHLYPHNVYFDPRCPTPSRPPSTLRPGDWLVVYQRRGIQYNAAEQRLRWDDGQSVAAELKLRRFLRRAVPDRMIEPTLLGWLVPWVLGAGLVAALPRQDPRGVADGRDRVDAGLRLVRGRLPAHALDARAVGRGRAVRRARDRRTAGVVGGAAR